MTLLKCFCNAKFSLIPPKPLINLLRNMDYHNSYILLFLYVCNVPLVDSLHLML